MAEETSMMSPADMAAVMGKGNQGGAWWLLVLFLFTFMGMGGWNNRQGGPQVATEASVQRGFDQSTMQNLVGGLSAQVGNGFADAAVSRLNTQQNLLQQMFNQQMGLQQTLNANQSQTNQGMNGIVMGLQQMGSMNQQGIADLKYTVAQENCADRQTINNGVRDLMAQGTAQTNQIVQSQQQGFQSVLDKMCQMEIDNLKQQNEQLRQQLNMAVLSASQTAQTAQITQNNTAQTAALVQRIAPTPIPAYTVASPYASSASST